jgi:hypothetical protein
MSLYSYFYHAIVWFKHVNHLDGLAILIFKDSSNKSLHAKKKIEMGSYLISKCRGIWTQGAKTIKAKAECFNNIKSRTCESEKKTKKKTH